MRSSVKMKEVSTLSFQLWENVFLGSSIKSWCVFRGVRGWCLLPLAIFLWGKWGMVNLIKSLQTQHGGNDDEGKGCGWGHLCVVMEEMEMTGCWWLRGLKCCVCMVHGEGVTYHLVSALLCSESVGLEGGAWCEHAQWECPLPFASCQEQTRETRGKAEHVSTRTKKIFV